MCHFLNHMQEQLPIVGVHLCEKLSQLPKVASFFTPTKNSVRIEIVAFAAPRRVAFSGMLAREWAVHYNQARPHKSLGPGIPDPPPGLPVRGQVQRHEVPEGFLIKKESVLGGLHHEYRLERTAA